MLNPIRRPITAGWLATGILATAIAGCAQHHDQPVTADSLARQAGCHQPADIPDPPLFVADAVDCLDPAWDHVSFYLFGNTEGRDSWLRIAQTFGDRGVAAGDRWVAEIPDDLADRDQVTALIADRLDGETVA